MVKVGDKSSLHDSIFTQHWHVVIYNSSLILYTQHSHQVPLRHDCRTITNPHNLCMYCTGGTECLSRVPGSHSVCAIRTLLGFDWKIFSSGKKLMLSGFLTLNAQSIILPHTGNE